MAAIVCFEAPHRVLRTLEEIGFCVKRPILVFRELTKMHEQTLLGTTDEIIAALPSPVGEFTLVIPTADVSDLPQADISPADLREQLGVLIENGAVSRRDAARELAARFGLSTKFVYNATKGSD